MVTKFKVLQYNQNFMAKLGIHSYRLNNPTNEFFRSPVALFILFILSVFSITSTGVYAYKHIGRFESAIQGIFVLIAGVQCAGMFIGVGIKMRQVKEVQLKLQEIVDEVKDGKISDAYWKNEQKCRRFTKILTFNYIILLSIVFLVLFIYSIYFILVGNFDPSALMLPYHMVVPFVTTTIVGWYLLWLIQCMMSSSYAMCVLSTTSYFVCTCIYIGTICEHFELLFASIEQDVEQIQNPESECNKLRRKIQCRFNQAVELHVKVYDIFKLVADINGGPIFSLLPLNAIFMGICFYGMEHSDRNLVSYAMTLIYMVTSSVWPYLFCFCATYVTDRLASIGGTAYNSNWYDYPVEWRKYIILIICRSQETVYFTGFNLIICTLNTFAMIIQSSCSYYLIFRRLAHTQFN